MARYEHLPLYRKAFGLLVYLETTVAGFSKAHRFGLGQDLRTLARRIVLRVVRANASPARATELAELRLEIEELLLLVRVAKEVRALSGLAAYEHCANEIIEMAKQNEGWLRSAVARPESRP